MSQAILISKNKVINSMYEVNLRAYVSTSVSIKKSLKETVELLEKKPTIDFIICFNDLQESDLSLVEFKASLAEYDLDIPIIVMGGEDLNLEHSIFVKNKYNIKDLLKAVAKILEISAQEMADMPVPKYFPIPIGLFSQIESSHCSVYSRVKKPEFEYEYVKTLDADIPVGNSLQAFIDAGDEHLYIDSIERLNFINKASRIIVTELDRKDLTASEKMEITEQGMEMVAEEIFGNSVISADVAEVSRNCIAAINNIVATAPKLKNILELLLENQSGFCYRHSIISSYVAAQMIDRISWGSKEQKEKVGFAFFFHDIFLSPIIKKHPDITLEEDLLFMDEVSDEDKQVVLDHAKLAGNLVHTFPRCPLGVDMIITQHHGMTKGSGFAVQYKDDISPLAKIMVIAEDICTSMLINLEQTGSLNINNDEVSQRLQDKYSMRSYKKIIQAYFEIST